MGPVPSYVILGKKLESSIFNMIDGANNFKPLFITDSLGIFLENILSGMTLESEQDIITA